jgi:hypothetical protein
MTTGRINQITVPRKKSQEATANEKTNAATTTTIPKRINSCSLSNSRFVSREQSRDDLPLRQKIYLSDSQSSAQVITRTTKSQTPGLKTQKTLPPQMPSPFAVQTKGRRAKAPQAKGIAAFHLASDRLEEKTRRLCLLHFSSTAHSHVDLFHPPKSMPGSLQWTNKKHNIKQTKEARY